MKPRKHSLLFSILALTLACLLFNASVIQVSCVPVIPILIAVASFLGGLGLGWLIWDHLDKQGKTPGVSLDSYVDAVAADWQSKVETLINYYDSVAEMLYYARDYFSRLGAYNAKNYVDKPDLDQGWEYEIMKDFAYGFRDNFTSILDRDLTQFGEALRNFAKDRLTGDLENYDVKALGIVEGLQVSLKDAGAIVPVYRLSTSAKLKAWVFGTVILAVGSNDAPVGADIDSVIFHFKMLDSSESQDLENYNFTITESSLAEVAVPSGIYEISFECPANCGHPGIRIGDILILSDFTNVKFAYAIFDYNRAGVALCNAFHVRGSGGSILRTIGLSGVEKSMLSLIQNIDNLYDSTWHSAKYQHWYWRNVKGYTSPSEIPPDEVTLPPSVIFPTTDELMTDFNMTWEEIAAAMMLYIQQFSKTINETLAQQKEEWNAWLDAFGNDVRQKFKDVIIKDVNGSLWAIVDTFIPLWLSKAQEFQANMTNILQGAMGAFVKFQNGTWKYVEIPAGWQIIPGEIVTPSGSVPSLLLQNYQGGINPAYTPSNATEPEFVTPANETILTTLQLVVAILPLVLILAIVRVIMDLGRR